MPQTNKKSLRFIANQLIRLIFDKPGTKSSSVTSAKSDSTKETTQPSLSRSISASGSTMISSIGDNSTTSFSASKVLLQSKLSTNIIFNSVINAKIIWSLLSVCEGFSNNSSKYLNQTVQSMFSECPTAKKFSLGPDKLNYDINWSLIPHYKDLLKTKLQNSEFFVIFMFIIFCDFYFMENVYKKKKEFNLGFAAEDKLKALQRRDLVKKEAVTNFL